MISQPIDITNNSNFNVMYDLQSARAYRTPAPQPKINTYNQVDRTNTNTRYKSNTINNSTFRFEPTKEF
ncbi:MAG: hypothetical protein CM15mV42_1350 [uncultured marine virus]|nr:MAG: hypothetical protein CM15mV42_1350 [uncultured marine virus]